MNVYLMAKKESFKRPVCLLQKGLRVIGVSELIEAVAYFNDGYDIEGVYVKGIEYQSYDITDASKVKELNEYFEREFGQVVNQSAYRIDFVIGDKEARANIVKNKDDERWTDVITNRKEALKLLYFIESLGAKQDALHVLDKLKV